MENKYIIKTLCTPRKEGGVNRKAIGRNCGVCSGKDGEGVMVWRCRYYVLMYLTEICIK